MEVCRFGGLVGLVGGGVGGGAVAPPAASRTTLALNERDATTDVRTTRPPVDN